MLSSLGVRSGVSDTCVGRGVGNGHRREGYPRVMIGDRPKAPINFRASCQRMSAQQDNAQRRSHGGSLTPARARVPVLVQFVQFGIVGISNTLLTFAVYTLLLKVFGVWYLAASAIGFAAGTVNSFLLNRRWTFRGHVGDALTPVRWTVVQCTGLALNLGLLYCSCTTRGST